MIFLVIILFFWALHLVYQIGKWEGIETCYDYIEENVEEFLKSIGYK